MHRWQFDTKGTFIIIAPIIAEIDSTGRRQHPLHSGTNCPGTLGNDTALSVHIPADHLTEYHQGFCAENIL